MLHYIKGKLGMKLGNMVVIEAGGLGYQLTVPENSSIYLKNEGADVMVFVAMIVREDDISLYGFGEKEGLDMFRLLITVNGVGAKAAMAILSAMPLDEVKKSIAFEDADSLTRANGIGKKTAQRIVLELKDKMSGIGDIKDVMPNVDQAAGTDQRSEAANALIALGYTKGEAINALSNISETELTSEQYIKMALKRLF